MLITSEEDDIYIYVALLPADYASCVSCSVLLFLACLRPRPGSCFHVFKMCKLVTATKKVKTYSETNFFAKKKAFIKEDF